MSTPRSNPHKARTQPTGRPLWLTVVLIAIGLLVLFGIGFGIASLLSGSADTASSEASPAASAVADNCTTVLIAPAEVLPQASNVTVNVYNSTKRAGLAGDTAKLLGVRGFKIGKVENDPLGVPIAGAGEIRFGPKGEAAAQLVAFHFPDAELINDGRKGKKVDVSLGKGFVELANDAEVVALLAKPTPSASPSGCPLPTTAESDATSDTGVTENTENSE